MKKTTVKNLAFLEFENVGESERKFACLGWAQKMVNCSVKRLQNYVNTRAFF